uniref:Secreted protein n=1 Tax=Steinernema glaseri TaxID=37863 RepID=A0A1I7Y8Q1_9BILA
MLRCRQMSWAPILLALRFCKKDTANDVVISDALTMNTEMSAPTRLLGESLYPLIRPPCEALNSVYTLMFLLLCKRTAESGTKLCLLLLLLPAQRCEQRFRLDPRLTI